MAAIGSWSHWRAAARAPLRDPEWPGQIAIGGALHFVPLIGAAWPAAYAAAYFQAIADGGDPDRLPEWREWGGRLVRGIWLWTVATIWLVPGAIALTVAAAQTVVMLLEGSGWLARPTGGSVSPVPAAAIGGLLLAAGLFATPASILLAIRGRSPLDPFRPGELGRLIGGDLVGYARLWIGWLAISLGLLIFGLTPPGWLVFGLLGSWIGFYLELVWAVLWAGWVAENPAWAGDVARILAPTPMDRTPDRAT